MRTPAQVAAGEPHAKARAAEPWTAAQAAAYLGVTEGGFRHMEKREAGLQAGRCPQGSGPRPRLRWLSTFVEDFAAARRARRSA